MVGELKRPSRSGVIRHSYAENISTPESLSPTNSGRSSPSLGSIANGGTRKRKTNGSVHTPPPVKPARRRSTSVTSISDSSDASAPVSTNGVSKNKTPINNNMNNGVDKKLPPEFSSISKAISAVVKKSEIFKAKKSHSTTNGCNFKTATSANSPAIPPFKAPPKLQTPSVISPNHGRKMAPNVTPSQGSAKAPVDKFKRIGDCCLPITERALITRQHFYQNPCFLTRNLSYYRPTSSPKNATKKSPVNRVCSGGIVLSDLLSLLKNKCPKSPRKSPKKATKINPAPTTNGKPLYSPRKRSAVSIPSSPVKVVTKVPTIGILALGFHDPDGSYSSAANLVMDIMLSRKCGFSSTPESNTPLPILTGQPLPPLKGCIASSDSSKPNRDLIILNSELFANLGSGVGQVYSAFQLVFSIHTEITRGRRATLTVIDQFNKSTLASGIYALPLSSGNDGLSLVFYLHVSEGEGPLDRKLVAKNFRALKKQLHNNLFPPSFYIKPDEDDGRLGDANGNGNLPTTVANKPASRVDTYAPDDDESLMNIVYTLFAPPLPQESYTGDVFRLTSGPHGAQLSCPLCVSLNPSPGTPHRYNQPWSSTVALACHLLYFHSGHAHTVFRIITRHSLICDIFPANDDSFASSPEFGCFDPYAPVSRLELVSNRRFEFVAFPYRRAVHNISSVVWFRPNYRRNRFVPTPRMLVAHTSDPRRVPLWYHRANQQSGSLKDRTFFHAQSLKPLKIRTARPIDRMEVGNEDADLCALPSVWQLQHEASLIQEFDDVFPAEKHLMTAWNEMISRHRFIADASLFKVTRDFILSYVSSHCSHEDEFHSAESTPSRRRLTRSSPVKESSKASPFTKVNEGLARKNTLILHLVNLYQFRVISQVQLAELTQLVQESPGVISD